MYGLHCCVRRTPCSETSTLQNLSAPPDCCATQADVLSSNGLHTHATSLVSMYAGGGPAHQI
ncbi:hypothetical protein EON65_14240 [archaeon]|nr:MAG: hypothetical protein EON65_14240 [archaeon]